MVACPSGAANDGYDALPLFKRRSRVRARTHTRYAGKGTTRHTRH
jgi:hypothetical protein